MGERMVEIIKGIAPEAKQLQIAVAMRVTGPPAQTRCSRNRTKHVWSIRSKQLRIGARDVPDELRKPKAIVWRRGRLRSAKAPGEIPDGL